MKFVAKVAALIGAVALATPAMVGAQTISTQVISGDGIDDSQNLVVNVTVSGNSGSNPTSCAFRVRFTDTAFAFDSVSEVVSGSGGGLGSPSASPNDETDGGSPSTFRDVATIGPGGGEPFPTSNQNPICFQITFDVLPGASLLAREISVELDPDASSALPIISFSTPFFSEVGGTGGSSLAFDNSATTFTEVSEWMVLE